ncbi:putative membrane protein [Saccharothrix espanaensis DSM 44229]|uniref:Putative membrane protein n=1 Tax=Saccharothrix espanaensis (strain ATCC 51144 / DSM 44229 / JCM 9112 / NBRC 15066 / NRRL 15764) TaxID=1179773 RepID=K0K847_SACES|nr:putative membrane protein [Saccharothrix espanaensis DSM 44229]
MDRKDDAEGSPPQWWSRARVAQACEHLTVGVEAASLTGPVLTGGIPVIYMTTGLLGLHFAASQLRKR